MVQDEVTGKTGAVTVRVLSANRNYPETQFLMLGGDEAQSDTNLAAYKNDADKLFAVFNRNLPSGTFARLVIEYLRQYRKDGATRSYDPAASDKACLRIINDLMEATEFSPAEKMTDPAGDY